MFGRIAKRPWGRCSPVRLRPARLQPALDAVPELDGVVEPAAGGGRGGAPRTEPEGVTETFHEIIDFEPVTEQELINPDPGDWLIYRRTYDSQGYSPLDQIDRSNVDDLGLEWVWAMADGTNQPTPLVHDGIMYLASPMNTIHASGRDRR